MQKQAELIALTEQRNDTRERLSLLTALIEKEYSVIALQWIQDTRWLRQYKAAHNKFIPDEC